MCHCSICRPCGIRSAISSKNDISLWDFRGKVTGEGGAGISGSPPEMGLCTCCAPRQIQSDNAHLPMRNRCKGWTSCSSYKQGPRLNFSGKAAGTFTRAPEEVFVGHRSSDPTGPVLSRKRKRKHSDWNLVNPEGTHTHTHILAYINAYTYTYTHIHTHKNKTKTRPALSLMLKRPRVGHACMYPHVL